MTRADRQEAAQALRRVVERIGTRWTLRRGIGSGLWWRRWRWEVGRPESQNADSNLQAPVRVGALGGGVVFAAVPAYRWAMWPFRRSSSDLLYQQREQLEQTHWSVAGEDARSTGGASSVVLVAVKSKKIPVIRVIRAETALGLKESKRLTDRGGVVADGLSRGEADRLVALLTDAGARARRVDPPPG